MAHAGTRQWQVGRGKVLSLDRPRLVAILNLTPDSFHDGGRLPSVRSAVDAAERAAEAGADALDLGGESTRPGAVRIGAEEQIRRVVPAIRAIRDRAGVLAAIPMTVDTTRAEVAAAALDAGADAVNDVSAGTEDPVMLGLAAARGAGLILMHRLAPPPQDSYSDQYEAPPRYVDVVASVREFLRERAGAAIAAGVAPERIMIDPGLGFGKSVEQNLELIRGTGDLASLGFPVLSALSRKSFVGRASGMAASEPGERLAATLALSVMHLLAGARVFRVHDVADHARALGAAWALAGGPGGGPKP